MIWCTYTDVHTYTYTLIQAHQTEVNNNYRLFNCCGFLFVSFSSSSSSLFHTHECTRENYSFFVVAPAVNFQQVHSQNEVNVTIVK